MSLTKLVTKNLHLYSVRPSQLVYKTEILSVSLRQVRALFILTCNFILRFYAGSGKTAAFVIPMLAFISSMPAFNDDNRHLGPYALIMAPTRELAQQIESEAMKFAAPLGFNCVSIVGGVCKPSTCAVFNTDKVIYSERLKNNSLICGKVPRLSSLPQVV